MGNRETRSKKKLRCDVVTRDLPLSTTRMPCSKNPGGGREAQPWVGSGMGVESGHLPAPVMRLVGSPGQHGRQLQGQDGVGPNPAPGFLG